MYKLQFHEKAEKEYTAAYVWYELQQEGLGDRFKLHVDAIVKKLLKQPLYFGYTKKPYREVSVFKFPYTIVFKLINKTNTVFISAVYHTSRNPKKKQRQ